MAFLPVTSELSHTSSVRTFSIPVDKWTSKVDKHTICFSEQVPCDTSVIGTVQMDLELTIYPEGTESSEGYVEVHFDIEAASLNRLASRMDQMFYEMSYTFVGEESQSCLFETIAYTHPTYNTNHCSKYSGVYFNHHYKCDSILGQFDHDGFITMQLWTKFTRADKWQFESNASVQQTHHTQLLDHLERSEGSSKASGKSIINILCKGREINCPKILLVSQSAAFEAMFSHDSKENLTGQIELEDSTPAAVNAMVTYLKKAQIPTGMQEDVLEIVKLAGRYLIDPLVRACENVMNNILAVDNAIQILISIDQHNLNSELREIVTDFMKDNISDIMKEADWKLFMAEYPAQVNDFIADLAEDRKRLGEEVKAKQEEQELGDKYDLSSEDEL